ncbi:hypothetical protein SAMN05216259_102541 [Actinacidiphila guanduensis]|uniref:Uncharacterized protein n=1 Tax=Actinacidiphila guanduensis TaxID=310781 RepID=A0A1G9YH64_9ACTN|nr:hypothetical protein SAMN05216259_102541 [Actinacidiphila guanduensis]
MSEGLVTVRGYLWRAQPAAADRTTADCAYGAGTPRELPERTRALEAPCAWGVGAARELLTSVGDLATGGVLALHARTEEGRWLLTAARGRYETQVRAESAGSRVLDEHVVAYADQSARDRRTAWADVLIGPARRDPAAARLEADGLLARWPGCALAAVPLAGGGWLLAAREAPAGQGAADRGAASAGPGGTGTGHGSAVGPGRTGAGNGHAGAALSGTGAGHDNAGALPGCGAGRTAAEAGHAPGSTAHGGTVPGGGPGRARTGTAGAAGGGPDGARAVVVRAAAARHPLFPSCAHAWLVWGRSLWSLADGIGPCDAAPPPGRALNPPGPPTAR